MRKFHKRKFHKFVVIIIACLLSQAALAAKEAIYKVVSTNSSRYAKVKTLQATARIELEKGKFLKVKNPDGKEYLLEGPYSAKVARKKGWKETLIETIRFIGKLVIPKRVGS